MAAEMRCVTSIYRLELGSEILRMVSWFFSCRCTQVLPMHYYKLVENIMRQWVYDCWNGVMDMDRNPLRHIPDLATRHMVLQVLAWMWCIVFSFWMGSFFVFGVSTIAHVFLLGAIAVTVGTFETAKRNPNFFENFPTSTPSRSRNYLWMNGQKIKLDPNDKGGEHE